MRHKSLSERHTRLSAKSDTLTLSDPLSLSVRHTFTIKRPGLAAAERERQRARQTASVAGAGRDRRAREELGALQEGGVQAAAGC